MNSPWVKWIEPFCYPLGVVWLAMVLTVLVLLIKRRWAYALWAAFLAVLLSVFGSTLLSYQLLAQLEKPYLQTDYAHLPSGDAVVMLGGTIDVSTHDVFGGALTCASSRALTAAELIRQKKSGVLVLGGGGRDAASQQREGPILVKWFSAWGLAPAELIPLQPSSNTHDEALQVQALAKKNGWKNIFLVTSGYHMKRAEALFRTLGIPVTPVACDFIGTANLESNTPFSAAPLAKRLDAAELFFHEWFGWRFYRWKGWIQR